MDNRRSGHQRLTEEIARDDRHATSLAVALGDSDHFKSVNDTYGHEHGDNVLRGVAAAMNQQMRDEDMLVRGGRSSWRSSPRRSKPERRS